MYSNISSLPVLSVSTTRHTISEQEPHHNQEEARESGQFWQFDEAIGEGRFFDEPYSIRLKAHISEERYHRSEGDEIVPLREKSGTRIYVMAKPYILIPSYEFTIGLYPQPTKEEAIGEVVSSDWVGMKQQEVASAQAWAYPEERTLILWECLLEHWYRKEDPRTDENLRAIWLGFEGFPFRHLAQIERIATPSWEPTYDENKEAWPGFLTALGYQPISKMAFGKAT